MLKTILAFAAGLAIGTYIGLHLVYSAEPETIPEPEQDDWATDPGLPLRLVTT